MTRSWSDTTSINQSRALDGAFHGTCQATSDFYGSRRFHKYHGLDNTMINSTGDQPETSARLVGGVVACPKL